VKVVDLSETLRRHSIAILIRLRD